MQLPGWNPSRSELDLTDEAAVVAVVADSSRHPIGDRLEYTLTDLGRSLPPLDVARGEWAVEHAPETEAARRRAN